MAERAPVQQPPPPPNFADGWLAKLLLIMLSAVLLSLAFSPWRQFYLAWIGLVPWLMVLRSARGPWRAAGWSWVGGVLFFTANMWWIYFVTGLGMIALMAWMGLYWAGAGAILWPFLRRVEPTPTSVDRDVSLKPASPLLILFLIPLVVVGFEWLHGVWPFNGLPWLYLGYSQTPILTMCQIGDITGDQGVSFWVAMLNALAFLLVIRWRSLRTLLVPATIVAGISVAILVYGIYRFGQEGSVLSPGPTVLVVQPNLPQDNSTGDKGAPQDEIINFHLTQTEQALQAARARGQQIDLVVWSETLMPPLNPEVRQSLWPRLRPEYQRWMFKEIEKEAKKRGWSSRELQYRLDQALVTSDDALFVNFAHAEITRLAQKYNVGMLVGSGYLRSLEFVKDTFVDAGRRNSAYLYQRGTGEQAGRFDKIHLVPFGEYIPFKEAWPWLYRQMIALGPPNMDSYQLEAGDQPIVFTLNATGSKPPTSISTLPAAAPATRAAAATPEKTWRFVTPICFEDIDGDLCARMFRAGAARGDLPNGKAADLIVNITNDGWFRGTEQDQHLQCATFRCIENRASMARSVNTGISGFIDTFGRIRDDLLLPAGTPPPGSNDPATLTHQVQLDSRTTFYTRWGNLVGPACGIVTGGLIFMLIGRRLMQRRRVAV